MWAHGGRPIPTSRRALALLAILAVWLAAGPAAIAGAEGDPAPTPPGTLYQWSDEKGVVRYTAFLERVPRSALARTLVIQRDPLTGAVAARPLDGSVAPPAVAATAPAEAPSEPVGSSVGAASPSGEVASLPPVSAPPVPTAAARTSDSALPPVSAAEPLPTVGPAPGEARGGWAIRLAATPVSSWLRPLEALRLLEGHRLYRVTRQVGDEGWERLRLGFFASAAQASAVRGWLEPHFPGAWVDRVDARELAESERGTIQLPERLANATPAPTRPDDSSHYAVQLRASPVDERLRALTRLELLDRHRLLRDTVEADGEVWERLAIGFFPSRKAAEAELERLVASSPEARVERVGRPGDAPAAPGPDLAFAR